jgi:hypothetical protein
VIKVRSHAAELKSTSRFSGILIQRKSRPWCSSSETPVCPLCRHPWRFWRTRMNACAANGGKEPSVSNAADLPNGSYAPKMMRFKN